MSLAHALWRKKKKKKKHSRVAQTNGPTGRQKERMTDKRDKNYLPFCQSLIGCVNKKTNSRNNLHMYWVNKYIPSRIFSIRGDRYITVCGKALRWFSLSLSFFFALWLFYFALSGERRIPRRQCSRYKSVGARNDRVRGTSRLSRTIIITLLLSCHAKLYRTLLWRLSYNHKLRVLLWCREFALEMFMYITRTVISLLLLTYQSIIIYLFTIRVYFCA